MAKNGAKANQQIKNNLLRWILFGCGWISIVAGVAGIVLPLLPTVPFLLLAAACFAKSSPRFHTWLVEHNHLGPLLRSYRETGCIPLKAKRISIAAIWVSIPLSAFLLVQQTWLRFILFIVASAVTIYLLRLPVEPTENS